MDPVLVRGFVKFLLLGVVEAAPAYDDSNDYDDYYGNGNDTNDNYYYDGDLSGEEAGEGAVVAKPEPKGS